MSMAIVATTSAVIGSLTFAGWNQSIDEVTLTLRKLALNTAFENVNATLRSVEDMAKVLGADPQIRNAMLDMRSNPSKLWREYPNVLTTFWTMGVNYPQIATVGFATNLPANNSYQYAQTWQMAMSNVGNGVFFYQDNSTYNATTNNYAYWLAPMNPKGWAVDRTVQALMFPPYAFRYYADARDKVDFNFSVDNRPWWQNAKYGGLLYPLFLFVWKGQPTTVGVPNEDPLGVIQVCLSAYGMDIFLQSMNVNPPKNSRQHDGEMVASSVVNTTVVPTSALTGVVHYNATDTNQTLIRETANNLLQQYTTYDNIPDNLQTSFTSPTYGPILVNIKLITTYTNLKWILVLCVPQSDFTGSLTSTQKRVIGAVSGTACGMLLLSAILAYALVHPIRKLSNTMIQATAFDFSAIRGGYLTQQSIFEPLEIAYCKAVFNTMLTRFAGAIQQNKSLVARGTTSSAAGQSVPGTVTGVATVDKREFGR
ncbi:hypothetical protein HK104_004261 [Borealophlyctis nickersoniae]|nr:hypothetical protein HK104_004261 [Borealophlyctis nickersoniae]